MQAASQGASSKSCRWATIAPLVTTCVRDASQCVHDGHTAQQGSIEAHPAETRTLGIQAAAAAALTAAWARAAADATLELWLQAVITAQADAAAAAATAVIGTPLVGCWDAWVGLLLGHAQQVDGGKQWGVEGHGWVPQHDVVHYVLIDLGVAVQLVGGDAVKQALCFPGHAWNAVHRPPHLDGLSVVGGLPHALHLHVQLAEEELAVEAQGPKDDAVILEALKLVAGIPEHDVFTVDVIV
mmetsp:Transcript_22673/g.62594  ORF Transcript_22673/g.62594 Transcript_22673/m.62594 type:complete len:241 (-) Transcript_22673:611-1333(-)|eukprot:CAMPEP_0202342912 /NCGR_PEP_ID=MMETSP1126-20121109/3270_1 /ASSEMBLY_ACC=CAM_ASM_000457 /TAXON_ID=3047 /ORGANISM="Dunaliella tertiolecta, Strain CCMP1320" /LENGTH=240 /DNA_ID=CAMNT_0048933929 /DNA_START=736 /DNA_END=1458 /DNA_ORIENTATION=-